MRQMWVKTARETHCRREVEGEEEEQGGRGSRQAVVFIHRHPVFCVCSSCGRVLDSNCCCSLSLLLSPGFCPVFVQLLRHRQTGVDAVRSADLISCCDDSEPVTRPPGSASPPVSLTSVVGSFLHKQAGVKGRSVTPGGPSAAV